MDKRPIILSLIAFLVSPAAWACHFGSNPEWSLEGFQNPESAFFDSATNLIYVSNVSGEPTAKDGRGFISTVSPEGKMVSLHWMDGMHAPKGIRVAKGKLYVTDIDRVLVIDIAKKKIVRTINIPKSKFLNDVAVDAKGMIYVSDTIDSALYAIALKGAPTKVITGEKAESPNGVYVDGDRVFIAAWGKNTKPDFSSEALGHLLEFDPKTGGLQYLTAKGIGNLDGLEKDQHGDWIVSDWMSGKIYHIDAKRDVRVLLSDKQGTADIGFVPGRNLVLIPQMKESRLTAYKLI